VVDERIGPGLRERKKARTRDGIRRQALRLFREQGYHATTMEQIARAADVAPSTLFRYFPTKDDLARLSDYHALGPRVAELFGALPSDGDVLADLRTALRTAVDELPEDERRARAERDVLIATVPELWAANLGLVEEGTRVLRDLLARRTGRSAHDVAVRSLAGAVVGVCVQALADCADRPDTDPLAAVDEALGALRAGLEL
jgi:AcrR family transcriptional regulator